MHEIQTVATADFGRLLHNITLQTQLNGLRSCLGWRHFESRGTLSWMGVSFPSTPQPPQPHLITDDGLE